MSRLSREADLFLPRPPQRAAGGRPLPRPYVQANLKWTRDSRDKKGDLPAVWTRPVVTHREAARSGGAAGSTWSSRTWTGGRG